MKKSIIVLAALSLAACGQPYPQNYQQAQGCNPQVSDCYGQGVGRDHSGMLVAGAVGLGAGYLAGRMHNNNGYGHNGGYDSGHRGYGYQSQRPRTVIINHYHSTPAAPYRSPLANALRRRR